MNMDVHVGRRTPIVHGDGLQSRDFTYVVNAVQAVIKAASAPGVSGGVYNVGTGRSISVLDLVRSKATRSSRPEVDL